MKKVEGRTLKVGQSLAAGCPLITATGQASVDEIERGDALFSY
jgi:hypothetical protein